MSAKFQLGKLVATPGALDAAPSQSELMQLVARHQSGDWGEVDEHDWKANETALTEGTRLLSAYTIGETKFWIITEWDRSVTTILLPDEY